jgi:uncharacterized protein
MLASRGVELSGLPIYDHHSHALFHEDLWRREPLEPYFTEASDPALVTRFARDTLFFRRSLRDLAEFYGCPDRVESVIEARQAWDYRELCRRMFSEAGITDWLIDDGLWADRLWSVEECRSLPPRIGRIVRVEAELGATIARHAPARDRPGTSLLAAFEASLRAQRSGAVAFKSIAAYRSGLEIGRPDPGDVDRAVDTLRQNLVPDRPPRVAAKPLIDAMLWLVLRVAAETGAVVQFHTGYGDPDLDLRLANPLHLRPIFEAPEFRGLRVVLLHCYPFVREAGYLASVYPGVYVDLGLTIPYASVHGMRTAVHEALHLAPVTKLLFSTDAQRTPELFWLAARRGRKVLGDVLDQTIRDGDLTADEAGAAAARILAGNAAGLYGELPGR